MADAQRAVRARIGRRIKQIRLSKRLTQEVLAGYLGRDQGHVSRLERGAVNTTINTLSKLASKLKLDVSEFFEPRRRREVFTITRRELDQIDRALRATARVRHAADPRSRAKGSPPKKT